MTDEHTVDIGYRVERAWRAIERHAEVSRPLRGAVSGKYSRRRDREEQSKCGHGKGTARHDLAPGSVNWGLGSSSLFFCVRPVRGCRALQEFAQRAQLGRLGRVSRGNLRAVTHGPAGCRFNGLTCNTRMD